MTTGRPSTVTKGALGPTSVAATVVAADGEPTEAFLYVKPDDLYVAGTPSPEYLAVLQDAYRRLGLEWTV